MHSALYLSCRLIVPLAAILLPPALYADVTKANNTTTLDTGASYTDGLPPTATDMIL